MHAAEGGLSAGQIMEVIGVSRSGLTFLLERAMAGGNVRRVGQGKGTKYVAG